MTDNHHHQMELIETHPTGVQEWRCPTCQRHFVLRQRPTFRRLILNEGDEHVSHSGSLGQVTIGPPALDDTAVDDHDLSPELRDALDDFFNDLGD